MTMATIDAVAITFTISFLCSSLAVQAVGLIVGACHIAR